jgi:hypothetical protein
MNVFSQIGRPDALRGACPVWEGLGGNRHPKGARRPHSTSFMFLVEAILVFRMSIHALKRHSNGGR